MKIKTRKGVTLDEIGEMLNFVVEHMATKDELAQARKELKGDMYKLSAQVNSIEQELREMRHQRLEVRVADLEDKVFGSSRS